MRTLLVYSESQVLRKRLTLDDIDSFFNHIDGQEFISSTLSKRGHLGL
jgi:hypothetical protein